MKPSIEVYGNNSNFGISETNNSRSIGETPFKPLPKLSFKISSIISYSNYSQKSVFITNEGFAYAIGDNRDGGISFSLPLQILNHFTKIELKDTDGHHLIPISAGCGISYTIFLASKKGLTRLVYSDSSIKTKSPVVLNTSGHNPISLFTGESYCASIDSEGAILIINKTICNSPSSPLERVFLPEGEKAVSVSCCIDFIISISSSGRTFYSKSGSVPSFSEIPELKGKEITCISGVLNHCIAVSKEGHVFVRGMNKYGRLGLGENKTSEAKFTEIQSLHGQKVISAYAGTFHSFFQTSEGKLFSCGDNDYGQLILDSIGDVVYSPKLTKVTNASFIIAGSESTIIFKNIVPSMSPNQTVKSSFSKRPKSEASESSESSEVERLKSLLEKEKKKVSELRLRYEDQLKKQKAQFEKEIERLKREKSLKESSRVSSSASVVKKIEILDKEAIQSYTKVSKISSGNFGKVYKVSKEVFYALKVLKNGVGIFEMKHFIGEYEIMNMLDHPNILKAFGLYLSETESPSILLEFCPKTLESRVKEKSLTNVDVAFFVYEIVEGMKYVHFRNVIHRDLKPTNILIGNDGTLKIGDFGISKLMSPEKQTMTCGIGTQPFMSPEIIDNNENYNEKVDVYSFGVLVFYILKGGELPKIKMSDKMKGKKAEIPSNFNQFARSLIDMCWNFKPEERPSFSQILNELEENDYKLVNLTKSEVATVKMNIEEHKKKIPKY